MRLLRPTVCLALVLLGAATESARAASFGAEAFGAFNTYKMAAWNDDLALANLAGGRFHRVTHGFTGGVGARVWPAPEWRLQADWEPIRLRTRDDATGRAIVFDAQTVQLGVGLFLPRHGAMRFGLGTGLGLYTIHGRRENGGVPNAALSGHSLGVHMQGLEEWSVARHLTVTGSLGYRIAPVSDTRVDGRSAMPKLVTDYSGAFARLGLAFDSGARR